MKTFLFTVSCFGFAFSLVGLPHAKAGESTTDASVAAESIAASFEAIAARWGKELDRVAYALEDEALAESGSDARVQSLVARAAYVRAQREQLQQCVVKRPSELARSLRASIESTPEASPIERNRVIAAINEGVESAAP